MSVFKDTRALATAVVGMVDSIMKGEEPEINDTESYDNGHSLFSCYKVLNVWCITVLRCV